MAFVTHFLPGLVLGLLVGAVATALLQPLLDRESNKVPTVRTPSGTKPSLDQPRDADPAMPVNPPASTTEKPVEPTPQPAMVEPAKVEPAKPTGTP